MYRARIENIGDTKYYAIMKGYSFLLGTEGHGANPVDAFLASLCGCIGHYVRDYLREQQLDYRSFSVDAEAELVAEKSKLSAIALCVDLKGFELDEPRRSEMLAYVERCKIHGTLRGSCPINIRLGQSEGGQP